MNQPDAKKHLELSLVKSGIRIVAGLALIFSSLAACGLLLIIAEIVGIAEELV